MQKHFTDGPGGSPWAGSVRGKIISSRPQPFHFNSSFQHQFEVLDLTHLTKYLK